MSDHFVTVQKFDQSFAAHLAKNLLETEGVASMLSGELSSGILFGNSGLGGQILLQVHEDDAFRAVGILAVVGLDKDWEEQAEADVWLCSICGEAIGNSLSMCYSCRTPKDSIRAAAPREGDAIQTDANTKPNDEGVQNGDAIVASPELVPAPPWTNRPSGRSTPFSLFDYLLSFVSKKR